MRNFFFALVFVSLISFGSLSALKSQAADFAEPLSVVDKYPYQITEIAPNGSENIINGESSSFDSQKIITDLGVAYYSEDKISVFPDPKLKLGGTIKILRAPVITIKDGKKIGEYRSWAKTAGQLLLEKNVELGTDDKINVSLSAEIFNGSSITITRVAITNIVETKSIDFQTLEKEDPNLDYGKKRIDAGAKGEKKLTYRVTREDGEEVSRILLSTEVIKEPKTQINYTGTKVTVLSSVSGRATMTTASGYVVSPNYSRGTLIRITNRANGKRIFENINATWGTASAPAGVVLDLAPTFLSQLGCPSFGCSSVLVEEIKQ